ncbi:MAG: polysaccharide deacetylase family protein [Clostridia bacterium]|nr:polysaccharide deacetylase family protein [Clostridia bacterium]MDD4387090.1 polysaccharide deacetylase family protein [Clostridia bacterium]
MKKILESKLFKEVTISVLILLIITILYLILVKLNKVSINLSNNDDVEIYAIKKYEPEQKIEEYLIPPKNFNFSIPIFMYHFISDDFGNATDTENYVSPLKLEQQLKYISENGYETVYINEFDKMYKYKKPVALTFDDCFVYFYNNAFPLLKKYNLKASIYIITDYIDGENYLTTEQIKEMKESNIIDIQSHTLSHPKLTSLKNEVISKELIDSKKALKEKFDIDSNVFCYPYGLFNDYILNITKENYTFALNMDGGIYYSNKHDIFKIPRIYANRSMPISTYINYLKQANVNVNW